MIEVMVEVVEVDPENPKVIMRRVEEDNLVYTSN